MVAVAPRATFDYKTRPILPLLPLLVANEPCVFMRFAIRLPDLPVVPTWSHVDWNLLNVKFDSEREKKGKKGKRKKSTNLTNDRGPPFVGRNNNNLHVKKRRKRNAWNG